MTWGAVNTTWALKWLFSVGRAGGGQVEGRVHFPHFRLLFHAQAGNWKVCSWLRGCGSYRRLSMTVKGLMSVKRTTTQTGAQYVRQWQWFSSLLRKKVHPRALLRDTMKNVLNKQIHKQQQKTFSKKRFPLTLLYLLFFICTRTAMLIIIITTIIRGRKRSIDGWMELNCPGMAFYKKKCKVSV